MTKQSTGRITKLPIEGFPTGNQATYKHLLCHAKHQHENFKLDDLELHKNEEKNIKMKKRKNAHFCYAFFSLSSKKTGLFSHCDMETF